jgi:ribosomal protein S18 acetylase RimI-like enzyme
LGELRPESPARRPETARTRSEAAAEAVSVDPPSPAEAAAVGRHLAELALHSGAVAVDEPDLGVLRIRGGPPGGAQGGGVALNFAALPRWTAEGWRMSLALLAQQMRADGDWPSLLLTERDRPIGLDALIGAQGWTEVNHETLLWVGAASVIPHLDPSLRIEAVQPDAVATHQALEARIFGLGSRDRARRDATLSAELASGRLRAYVVRVGGEPVAVARVSLGERDAGLYAIGVDEGWRRQGFGTLITIIATRAGLALGKRVVWLSVEEGNEAARAMYERLGFRQLFHWGRWVAEQP